MTQECFESSTDDGSLSTSAQRILRGCDWTLLLTAKGGPGEVPGREAAVSKAVAATAEKRRVKLALEDLKMKKKRKGR